MNLKKRLCRLHGHRVWDTRELDSIQADTVCRNCGDQDV